MNSIVRILLVGRREKNWWEKIRNDNTHMAYMKIRYQKFHARNFADIQIVYVLLTNCVSVQNILSDDSSLYLNLENVNITDHISHPGHHTRQPTIFTTTLRQHKFRRQKSNAQKFINMPLGQGDELNSNKRIDKPGKNKLQWHAWMVYLFVVMLNIKSKRQNLIGLTKL